MAAKTKTTKTTAKTDKATAKVKAGKTDKATAKVKPPKVRAFSLKGKAGQAQSAEGVDGVTRTRAQWNGHSLCSLLKWVGFNGGTLENARQLVAALGLGDVTSASTISCQQGAGAQLAAGVKPHHSGQPADLSKDEAKQVRKLAGM